MSDSLAVVLWLPFQLEHIIAYWALMGANCVNNISGVFTQLSPERELSGLHHTHFHHFVGYYRHTHTHTHTHNHFTSVLDFVLDYPGEPAPERETNLDLLEQEIVNGSGIIWTICKPAPWPRHITMPTSHHSVFTGWSGCPSCRPTNSITALKVKIFGAALSTTEKKDHVNNLPPPFAIETALLCFVHGGKCGKITSDCKHGVFYCLKWPGKVLFFVGIVVLLNRPCWYVSMYFGSRVILLHV